LVIGQIVSPFGVRGAVKIEIMTDFPHRFGLLRTIYVGDKLVPHELTSFRLRTDQRHAILQLSGCHTRDEAEGLRDQMIWVPREQAMPLEKGQYYVFQVVGLTVQSDTGETLGKLTEVIFTGSNDVYVVQKDGREILVPVLEDVILNVDLAARIMIVHLPDGLV
jgi:16S rRNA processing protein RimM